MKHPAKYSLLKSDLKFLFISAFMLMLLQSIFRGLLLWRNIELSETIPQSEIVNAFLVGMRFDLIMTAYAMIPIVLYLLHRNGINRLLASVWLTIVGAIFTFFAILELDFYHEFHVRLNSLVFQYIREDANTVISMIWYGFPVVRYLILITAIVGLFYWALNKISQHLPKSTTRSHYAIRLVAFFLVVALTAVSARGTVRHGPPLRWGDAFHSDYLFTNHLALNGAYTLTKAFVADLNSNDNNKWLTKMPQQDADSKTQQLLISTNDSVIDNNFSPVLRTQHAGESINDDNRPLNVVLILMESFSAEFVGSLGHDYGITPEFDRLRKKGLLYKNFFSNGTHTHQGMFASMSCFPNLPGYEYLMQQPEGDTEFSGILKIINDKNYQSLYVYNGDFAWDNQRGFFGGQGMQRFIGRHDFVNPKFSDPTWGVSDEDMFTRAAEELARQPGNEPYFAFIQTLSNHTPYALPDPLPVKKVTGHGSLDEHLTAMRYSDWALGEFFKKVEKLPDFTNTLFVIVGDHGFSTSEQLTDIDILRFHVPLLLIGPNIVSKYGDTSSIVGSQVDIAPTVSGLLGGENRHSCWGRDLLNTADAGFAVVKPSGSDQTTAYIEDNYILISQPEVGEKLYQYEFGTKNNIELLSQDDHQNEMKHKLDAYIQTALNNLLHGTVGDSPVH